MFVSAQLISRLHNLYLIRNFYTIRNDMKKKS